MVCPRCGTDDPGVYLGLNKLECVNSECAAYVKPEVACSAFDHMSILPVTVDWDQNARVLRAWSEAGAVADDKGE